jgi:hypothetical protein
VSTEVREIKKSLLKADEEVEDKIAKEGGGCKSHQKGYGCQKRDKWRTSRRKKVEDIDGGGDDDHADENTPNPHSRQKRISNFNSYTRVTKRHVRDISCYGVAALFPLIFCF